MMLALLENNVTIMEFEERKEIFCDRCGECRRECRLQMDAITLTEHGVSIDLAHCNRCGHCAAVCPTGKMDNPYAPMQEEIMAPPDPDTALRFLRAPRSVRRYKSKLVPKEVLCRLLDAGRYPPTAKNAQGVEYHIVRGRENVDRIHALYDEIVREISQDDPQYELLIAPIRRQAEKNFDALFYEVPQLIFAVWAKDKPYDPRSVYLSFSYITLMAPVLGLGTCWCGQMQRLAERKGIMPRIATAIGLSEDRHICGCLLVGYPNVRFRRLVQRDPLRVTWSGEVESL